MALTHAIENKVEASYRRGDLFQKRRQLMEAWAKFCNTPAAMVMLCRCGRDPKTEIAAARPTGRKAGTAPAGRRDQHGEHKNPWGAHGGAGR